MTRTRTIVRRPSRQPLLFKRPDLALAARFDAATAMFVLMHLPDDGAKLHLLRGVTRRHKPGATLLVDSLRDHPERFLLAMERYAAAPGMPAKQLAAVVACIRAGATTVLEERERALLAEAAFMMNG